jgi:hypothetical protein
MANNLNYLRVPASFWCGFVVFPHPMRRFLYLYALVWISGWTYSTSTEAGWCKRQLLRFSFAVSERLQKLEPREAALYLDNIDSRTVRLDLQPNWEDFTKSAEMFELALLRLPQNLNLAQFRQITFVARQKYLADIAADLDRRLLARNQGRPIGFHFNKNGGSAPEFVWRGGLYVTHGDLWERRSLTYRGGLRGNTSTRPVKMGLPTVFYFHSSDTPFSEFVLTSLYRSTPNDVAIFDVQQVQSVVGVAARRGYYGRAFSFSNKRAGETGVSVDSFVLPPLRLLTVEHLREALPDGTSLSCEELEFAALRHFLYYLQALEESHR